LAVAASLADCDDAAAERDREALEEALRRSLLGNVGTAAAVAAAAADTASSAQARPAIRSPAVATAAASRASRREFLSPNSPLRRSSGFASGCDVAVDDDDGDALRRAIEESLW
jgi:hypothetical protein